MKLYKATTRHKKPNKYRDDKEFTHYLETSDSAEYNDMRTRLIGWFGQHVTHSYDDTTDTITRHFNKSYRSMESMHSGHRWYLKEDAANWILLNCPEFNT